MIEGYRTTGARIVTYARDTGLFDVPAEYKLEVTVAPPPLRSSLDGAAYYTAPVFKQGGHRTLLRVADRQRHCETS